ncbi:MAG: hypothetical protein ACREN8_12605 [Candidatus Dormibacteraceae bacterium]
MGKDRKRGLIEPTIEEDGHGFKSLFDTVLIISFAWGPPAPGEEDHTYLLPLDTRKILIDPWDDQSITTLIVHHLEFTLGCQIDMWEAERAVTVGENISIVKPWKNESGLP